MSLLQVMKTELYKNCHRKSSLMMFIPMLLSIVITFGYSRGIIALNLTAGSVDAYSCMDFVFVVWNVLSGLGIMGILLILFAAFQFSGEIERGQIKLMLLRIGRRSTVVMGKYLSTVLAAAAAIAGTLLACIVSYYVFVSNSAMGTGTFGAAIEGLSSGDIMASIVLQMLVYIILIGITFLAGLFANPFITFVLTIIVMYAVNYLAGSSSFLSRLLPSYWSNQLMMNGSVPVLQTVGSVCFAVLLTACVIGISILLFQKRDVK